MLCFRKDFTLKNCTVKKMKQWSSNDEHLLMFLNKERKKTAILTSATSHEKAATWIMSWFDPEVEAVSQLRSYLFQVVSGQFECLLAELGPHLRRKRNNFDWPGAASSCESSLWGKTILFEYFCITIYSVLVHVLHWCAVRSVIILFWLLSGSTCSTYTYLVQLTLSMNIKTGNSRLRLCVNLILSQQLKTGVFSGFLF